MIIVRRSTGTAEAHHRPFDARVTAIHYLEEHGRAATVRLLDGLHSAHFHHVTDAMLVERIAAELERGRLIVVHEHEAAGGHSAKGSAAEPDWISVDLGRPAEILIDRAAELPDVAPMRVFNQEDAARIVDAIMKEAKGAARLRVVVAEVRKLAAATDEVLREAAVQMLFYRQFHVFEARRGGGGAGKEQEKKKDEPARPAPPPRAASPKPANDHWIAIELKDEDGDPVAGAAYEITLPDGAVRTGVLDDKGKARLEGIKQGGYCQITFPEIDAREWKLG